MPGWRKLRNSPIADSLERAKKTLDDARADVAKEVKTFGAFNLTEKVEKRNEALTQYEREKRDRRYGKKVIERGVRP